ncbi:alpha/beta hydrolase domain-containing protein [Larkinella humicola]|uniref:Tannase/feruloyl esterase family alpha/beta hydrolase n=1 Tax=Larkinella humicola TaxID=2607654 RepID=A0A5N1JJJ0_9BACT|nr:alpha/beta hydrolase domain-containing protein [Larkinella humicola]KAA9355312.1 tannase/feruloyl esterase family alpha/beta hydrolase [Larkinella humicola]
MRLRLNRFLLLLLVVHALPLQARIVRIEITSRQSPAFEGRVFGPVGTYEKLRGKAYGQLDPNHPPNAVITDIRLAPRNAKGMVEYAMDIYILKPVNLKTGTHKLFLEVNNRGAKLFGGLNNSRGGNDPTTADEAGDAFLMNRGYTLAWNGWDPSAASANNNLTITVPVVNQADGTPITGPSYEYISFDNATSTRYALAYPAASLDKSRATLTVRDRLSDTPTVIPADRWEYTNERTIRLVPEGTVFRQSAIYEFAYTARDPIVAGIGFAATRDFVSFLRYAKADDFGNPNPLADDVQFTFSYTLSQPARYLNDFQTLGFNADEQNRRVIDGMENWLGGGSGIGLNVRFAQPSRTERNRQNHLYPEAVFPFAYPVLTDPFTGKTAGRLAACSVNNTCSKVFEINSANEYWVKAASLLHTDLQGNDLPDPENVRFFLVSGAQHGTGNATTGGICQQVQNPTNAEPLLRALFMALDDWVTKGIKPPDSEVPRRSNGTAVVAIPRAGSQTGVIPQADLGWPTIPGVTYTGLITTRYQLDFITSFAQGSVGNYPPSVANRPTYANFVSKVDQDGNEIAGIRLPPVAVPVATTTGWALRRTGFGENEGCEGAGQYIPFKVTKAERASANDPRLSLQERYQTHAGYVEAVRKAAQNLAKRRLLLAEDVQQYVKTAEESTVLN